MTRRCSRLARLLVVALLPILAARADGQAAAEAPRNPFTCLELASEVGARPIVLVSAHTYYDRHLIEKRLRAVAAAEPGGDEDVSVFLTGLVCDDPRSLAYQEWRLGRSMHGRLFGMEESPTYSIASLTAAMFALSLQVIERPHTASREEIGELVPDGGHRGAASEFAARPDASIVCRAVLRQLYLLPELARAWREIDRPLVLPRNVDWQHVSEVERVFDAVVAAVQDPTVAPAPDDPAFDERVLAPNRGGMNDPLAFMVTVRALLRELLARTDADSLARLDVAPDYAPDLAMAQRCVRDDFLAPTSRFVGAFEDICLRWRHYGAVARIADVYCRRAPGKGVEVILGTPEVAPMARLLRDLLGPNVPVVIKDIDDLL